MKNVAKCDTWCELQNPVNHRVFERKLRPKPLGRGHACLGVTHRHPHANAHRGESWPPARQPSWLVENQGNVGVPREKRWMSKRSRPIVETWQSN
ncbi:hypothetical protein VIGAN_UM125900 [Vigna angularis var. angularis]|uniref:Uncharacterized protein n=1 Tax=Vigna angularis var. angularis TaxID=157739 RepID=A0A0S3TEM4_PHAAN|nr:hypothetical protein VIGAN_UM125900 [Vigna angularis var. angularis]